MSNIRPCRHNDRAAILAIINAAAEAYRGVIPADQWHEPYMPRGELDKEIAAGVTFWGHEQDGALVGVMGFQPVRNVDLIRHAYVLPGSQRRGVGGALPYSPIPPAPFRVGVSGITPVRWRAKVSRPVVSQSPMVARRAKVSKVSVQSPSV
jgi:GNAT superfamily N-acetyltransferase